MIQHLEVKSDWANCSRFTSLVNRGILFKSCSTCSASILCSIMRIFYCNYPTAGLISSNRGIINRLMSTRNFISTTTSVNAQILVPKSLLSFLPKDQMKQNIAAINFLAPNYL